MSAKPPLPSCEVPPIVSKSPSPPSTPEPADNLPAVSSAVKLAGERKAQLEELPTRRASFELMTTSSSFSALAKVDPDSDQKTNEQFSQRADEDLKRSSLERETYNWRCRQSRVDEKVDTMKENKQDENSLTIYEDSFEEKLSNYDPKVLSLVRENLKAIGKTCKRIVPAETKHQPPKGLGNWKLYPDKCVRYSKELWSKARYLPRRPQELAHWSRADGAEGMYSHQSGDLVPTVNSGYRIDLPKRKQSLSKKSGAMELEFDYLLRPVHPDTSDNDVRTLNSCLRAKCQATMAKLQGLTAYISRGDSEKDDLIREKVRLEEQVSNLEEHTRTMQYMMENEYQRGFGLDTLRGQDLQELHTRNGWLVQDLEKSKSTIRNLEYQLEEANLEHNYAFQSLQNEGRRLQREVEQHRVLYAKRCEENEELRARIETANQRGEDEEKASALQKENLEQEILKHKSMNNDLTKAKSEFDAKFASLEERLIRKQEEIQSLNKALADSDDMLQQVRRENVAKQNEIDSLLGGNRHGKLVLDSKMQDKLKSLQDELADMKEQMKLKEDQLISAQQVKKKLDSTVTRLKQDMIENRERFEEELTRLQGRDLEALLSTVRAENTILREQNRVYELQCGDESRDLVVSLERMKRELEFVQQDKDELHEQHNALCEAHQDLEGVALRQKEQLMKLKAYIEHRGFEPCPPLEESRDDVTTHTDPDTEFSLNTTQYTDRSGRTSENPVQITVGKSGNSEQLPSSTSFGVNADTASTSSSDVLPVEAVFGEDWSRNMNLERPETMSPQLVDEEPTPAGSPFVLKISPGPKEPIESQLADGASKNQNLADSSIKSPPQTRDTTPQQQQRRDFTGEVLEQQNQELSDSQIHIDGDQETWSTTEARSPKHSLIVSSDLRSSLSPSAGGDATGDTKVDLSISKELRALALSQSSTQDPEQKLLTKHQLLCEVELKGDLHSSFGQEAGWTYNSECGPS